MIKFKREKNGKTVPKNVVATAFIVRTIIAASDLTKTEDIQLRSYIGNCINAIRVFETIIGRETSRKMAELLKEMWDDISKDYSAKMKEEDVPYFIYLLSNSIKEKDHKDFLATGYYTGCVTGERRLAIFVAEYLSRVYAKFEMKPPTEVIKLPKKQKEKKQRDKPKKKPQPKPQKKKKLRKKLKSLTVNEQNIERFKRAKNMKFIRGYSAGNGVMRFITKETFDKKYALSMKIWKLRRKA